MIDRTIWWDDELPELMFSWREHDPGSPRGTIIDFLTTAHTFRLQFLVARTHAVAYDKSTNITALLTDPNIKVVFTPDELKNVPLQGQYLLRLIARRTSNSADRSFPWCPTVDVIPVA